MFICVHMHIKNTNGNSVWATEKETAKHYKIKPATLRKHRSLYGHDGSLLYRKIGGSVRYNLDTNDRQLEVKDLRIPTSKKETTL